MTEAAKFIDPDLIRDFFLYSEETGDFIYREPETVCLLNRRLHLAWLGRNVGRRAASVTNKGYITFCLLGVPVLAHRAAWVYVTGRQPSDQLDHIDGDKTNNKFSNLRECGNQENSKNQKLRVNNRSGIAGVRINTDKYGKMWIAAIGNTYLGSFDDFFEACCARKSAENKLNYHPNHGRIAA